MLLLQGLYSMSLAKLVPDGLKPWKCKRLHLREPLPVPYVPVKGEVQEEVSKMQQHILDNYHQSNLTWTCSLLGSTTMCPNAWPMPPTFLRTFVLQPLWPKVEHIAWNALDLSRKCWHFQVRQKLLLKTSLHVFPTRRPDTRTCRQHHAVSGFFLCVVFCVMSLIADMSIRAVEMS